MPRGTYLTELEKGKIFVYHESGLSIREIGRKLNGSHNVVMNFLKNPDGYGVNKSGGPKKKVSKRTERKIIPGLSNSTRSINQIKADLHFNVSRSTVYRVISRNPHIVRQNMKKVPRLLDRHKEARIEYGRSNIRRDWNNVRIC